MHLRLFSKNPINNFYINNICSLSRLIQCKVFESFKIWKKRCFTIVFVKQLE